MIINVGKGLSALSIRRSPINVILKRFLSTSKRNLDKISEKHNLDRNNEPVPFFGSPASNWQAKKTRGGGSSDKTDEEILWYQPYVVTGSVAIFLLYFCVLREENDIDRKLEASLFDHVESLEETQLILSYKYNKEHGLDVKDIENRLKELNVDIQKCL